MLGTQIQRCASVLWLRCVQLLAKEHVYKLLVPGGKAPKRKPETTNEDLKPPEGKLEPKPKGKAKAKAGTSKKTKLAKEWGVLARLLQLVGVPLGIPVFLAGVGLQLCSTSKPQKNYSYGVVQSIILSQCLELLVFPMCSVAGCWPEVFCSWKKTKLTSFVAIWSYRSQSDVCLKSWKVFLWHQTAWGAKVANLVLGGCCVCLATLQLKCGCHIQYSYLSTLDLMAAWYGCHIQCSYLRTLDMIAAPSDNKFWNFWVVIKFTCQVLFTSLLVSCNVGEGACGKATWPAAWLGALPEEFLGCKVF